MAGWSGEVGAFSDVLSGRIRERGEVARKVAAAFIPATHKVCSCLITVQWKGSHIPALSLKGIR